MKPTKLLRLHDRMWAHVVGCGACGVSRYGSRLQKDTRCDRGRILIARFATELRRRVGR